MTDNFEEKNLREELLYTARKLVELNLNRGTSGNLSVRYGNGFLVTPSGVTVDVMSPEMMVLLDRDGNTQSDIKPTSEWHIHKTILNNRSDVNAVIHTHSMFATTLACLHMEVPPFHYMIAVTGSDTISCTPYALFGSKELSDNVLKTIGNGKACLLANHGMVALGRDLKDALAVTQEVENLCEQYWRILQIDKPKILSSGQMKDVFERFKTYGQWNKPLETKKG